MLRLLLLPLFLFTLSMACMGQTFQYSRGWTNGKRAPPAALVTNGHNLGLLDIYDIQDRPTDIKLERCLLQLQHFVGNALLHRSFANGLAYSASRPDPETDVRSINIHSRPGSGNNNIENSLYPNVNHRQSNELFEALNAPGPDAVEPNDYGKH
ncbi:pro-corazonin [Drosophila virilis]|uniref:Pro-corazonin n=1 Tax=Drosophila virilis TaxID=7244 RepID=CORZ_DROVI|nr:pro-corazonin [Drosophila virilis]Q5W1L3.1 RecName: Full=Pro-corazonin; Short=Crz; Short=Dv-Crz; Contains: RecName: Full=Corazonin; Contains: RecName: Full=Corazonin precursor-related peptide; Short=CPRP; Flags: Precursor [Drosophila virilis]EDW58406.1 corazonin [Drosophila virilis]CAH65473.1 preprocorazonin [Drosophila virilis]